MDFMNRINEYDKYLRDHVKAVNDSLELVISYIQKDYGFDVAKSIIKLCNKHDNSKYEVEEYFPYLNYFYPSDENDEDVVKQDFDAAWLHHQNHNPHHWQYWVLRRDEGEEVLIDMPVKYIIEMLCDWHSFSRKDNNSTAYKWYYSNIDKIKISENTRKIVEKYIGFFKIPLKQMK